MCFWIKKLAIAFFVFLHSTAALTVNANSKVLNVRYDCPWISQDKSWYEYLNQKPTRKLKSVAFQIHFDQNDRINDTLEYNELIDPLGILFADSSYTVIFDTDKKRGVGIISGYDEKRKCTRGIKLKRRQIFDRGFILADDVFTIENTGKVYSSKYGYVGNAYCTLTNDRGWQPKKYRPC